MSVVAVAGRRAAGDIHAVGGNCGTAACGGCPASQHRIRAFEVQAATAEKGRRWIDTKLDFSPVSLSTRNARKRSNQAVLNLYLLVAIEGDAGNVSEPFFLIPAALRCPSPDCPGEDNVSAARFRTRPYFLLDLRPPAPELSDAMYVMHRCHFSPSAPPTRRTPDAFGALRGLYGSVLHWYRAFCGCRNGSVGGARYVARPLLLRREFARGSSRDVRPIPTFRRTPPAARPFAIHLAGLLRRPLVSLILFKGLVEMGQVTATFMQNQRAVTPNETLGPALQGVALESPPQEAARENSDFLSAHAKILSYLTCVMRWGVDNQDAYGDALLVATLRLLQDCPMNAIGTAQDKLFDERVLLGTGVIGKEMFHSHIYSARGYLPPYSKRGDMTSTDSRGARLYAYHAQSSSADQLVSKDKVPASRILVYILDTCLDRLDALNVVLEEVHASLDRAKNNKKDDLYD
ncbi:hypothetical protein FB451DRAFT_1408447 [Mycena latifolia]|nr:hypothetical protein FB451DRAFT_1408447 [Mycena latifolia]